MSESIGVAVVGAGMAGRAHANGYRTASAVFDAGLPNVRLVAIADQNEAFAEDAAQRYGFDRAESDWRAVARNPAIDAVSVVVANHLHRQMVEGLLEAGKHVLCEKPLAHSIEDAESMVQAAQRSDHLACVGFTFRRSPAINAVREQIRDGQLGAVSHFNGHYWCDYGFSPNAPMSWRYKGTRGSGALADIGSHIVDVGEFLCGPVQSVQGTKLTTVVPDRPLPLGVAVGHAATEVSDTRELVENDDIATFTATFAGGAVGTFSVSRVAFGHPNSLGFEVFCAGGAATFDLRRPAEFSLADTTSPAVTGGYRQVLLGPEHPYITRGLAMDFPGVGHGVNEFFAYQARAFLDEIAGLDRLPRCARLSEGLHNLRVLQAVTDAEDGKTAYV